MAGSTIDHIVALTVFLAALLLFISLFNQTIQTAILYQQHRHLATVCSDLLDNVMLNPGYPLDWGKTNSTPTSFGLQDPEFTQYRLSPYSLMRLQSLTWTPFTYPVTGVTYSNLSTEFGSFLFVPCSESINYLTATKLLGIENVYGFELTVAPIVTVSIGVIQPDPLTFRVNIAGTGFPLSNASVTYSLVNVTTNSSPGACPSYNFINPNDTAYADDKGSATLSFDGTRAPYVNGTQTSYALIAYAHLSGLIGVGCYEHVASDRNYPVPFISDFANGTTLIAHSYDVSGGSNPQVISYNATYVLLTEDFTLRETPLDNSTGEIAYGSYQNLTIPTFNPGILVITYQSDGQSGVVLMPWGMSSMAFPVTFGSTYPFDKEWVVTDIRQVLVNSIAYQARLSLWSLKGYGVIG